MLVEKIQVFGWDSAIRGMRNPLNSWNRIDSKFLNSQFVIGENDLKLMKQLAAAGSDHAKFLRMINVTMDVTAPLYWWKEADTYKVGTVANSCSTMHKIQAKEFTVDDFSCGYLHNFEEDDYYCELLRTIKLLNKARDKFNETQDKKYWWLMIQLLPSSYNQKRTLQLNYQVLKHMYDSRKNHKLDEWRDFCKIIEQLPYFKEIFNKE